MSTEVNQLDTSELEQRVKHMYREVALEPEHEFHFRDRASARGAARLSE
jgi:hypothetical protein